MTQHTHAVEPAQRAQGGSEGTWLGHPRGLTTLFFTEMWERFSYYGMRALLVLFMTAAAGAAGGGLGLDDGTATAVYGLYTSLVYLLALPGGWIADRLWGQQRSVFVGGAIIALGHFTLAAPIIGLPETPTFFAGLLFIVLGTGLLKPNVSTIVGQLYERRGSADGEEDRGARRDAGFSIFYMGINLGAILGPFVCGTLGEKVNFHWGFSAAGFGMLLGLVQYRLGRKHLGDAGALVETDDADLEARARLARRFWTVAVAVGVAVAAVVSLGVAGIFTLSLETFATWFGYALAAVTLGYFVWLIAFGGYGREERRRIGVILWLVVLASVFWSGFEQAGSSMNLFAERLTDRNVGGWTMPTSWLQNVNPIFIIVLAPVFGWVWTWLASRHRNPSIPMKFALGLLGLSAGFFVIAWGAAGASAQHPVPVSWLVVTYFLHTVGELCLSPVGLSSITKLSPRDRVSQMMGLWFVAAALGNLAAGLLAGRLESQAPSRLFTTVATTVGAAGLVALAASPLVKRLVGRVS